MAKGDHGSAFCFGPRGREEVWRERLDMSFERSEVERFREVVRVVVERGGEGAVVVEEAGDEERFQLREVVPEFAEEIESAHAGHEEIGDDEGGAFAFVADHSDRFFSVRGLDGADVFSGEEIDHEGADHGFIVHNENGDGVLAAGSHKRKEAARTSLCLEAASGCRNREFYRKPVTGRNEVMPHRPVMLSLEGAENFVKMRGIGRLVCGRAAGLLRLREMIGKRD